jgi:TPP-dependent pyruvate/acetoin dehydrogenase alpha subunit
MSTALRSKNLGQIEGLSSKFSKEISLELFKKMCVCRQFELNVKKAYDEKFIKAPVYLSFGQESIAAALSVSFPKPYIFAQHRSHDVYLSYGGDPHALTDELLGKPAGCAHGMAGSSLIHSPKIGMFGHTGFIGDQIPIAVGFALGSNKKTLAILGDAAAEEDYVLGALGYAAHKKLPILFVCYDNNLSILTEVKVRRSWKIADIARAFGMEAVDIADDPWLIMHYVEKLSKNLPVFMNIHTVRHLWHSGTGIDGPPEWDRYQMVKDELVRLGWEGEVKTIEGLAVKEVEGWWQKSLNELVIEYK